METFSVQTTRFGEVEIEKERVIRFCAPILGFDQDTDFIILDHAEDSPFKWLQSTTAAELAFVVTNPGFFGIDYEFALPQDVADKLEITKPEEALVLTIVNIPQGNPSEMTANLLGPIIINQTNRTAMQVVLSDTEYSTKAPLIPEGTAKQEVSSSASGNEGE